MAVSPGTTNIAVDREIAERLREVAKEAKVTALEVANQILRAALDQGQIKLQVREVVIDLSKAGSKPPAKKSK